MKRLFTTFLLLCLALPCFSQTPEEEYSAFRVDGWLLDDGVRVWGSYYSAWLEVQDAHLDVKIPPAKILQRWGYVSDTVSLRDFTLDVIDLDGPTSLILLSAKDGLGQTGRKSFTTAEALKDWVENVIPFGYKKEDLLSREEARMYWESEAE